VAELRIAFVSVCSASSVHLHQASKCAGVCGQKQFPSSACEGCAASPSAGHHAKQGAADLAGQHIHCRLLQVWCASCLQHRRTALVLARSGGHHVCLLISASACFRGSLCVTTHVPRHLKHAMVTQRHSVVQTRPSSRSGKRTAAISSCVRRRSGACCQPNPPCASVQHRRSC
jgi:hypothetical protein